MKKNTITAKPRRSPSNLKAKCGCAAPSGSAANYRITTNGLRYRIQFKTTVGILWRREKWDDLWIITGIYSGSPLEYKTIEEAESALLQLQEAANKRHGWIPVQNVLVQKRRGEERQNIGGKEG